MSAGQCRSSTCWLLTSRAQNRNDRLTVNVMSEERPEGHHDDELYLPMICPVTGAPCMTEQDEFCEDYGCARKAGIDVDRDLIA